MNFPTYKILSLGEFYIDRVKKGRNRSLQQTRTRVVLVHKADYNIQTLVV